MRKTAAILILMLLVFNTVGYKLWFSIAMQKADHTLEAALDKQHFNQQDLFTLKIPINLPYQNGFSSFERVNGEISVNGIVYKYVQSKVANDTLFLQCIRHTEKNSLAQQSNDYFGKVNDVAGNNDVKKLPGKNSSTLKFALADFIHDTPEWKLSSPLPASVAYLIKPCGNSGSAHAQQLIKPPQSV